MESRSPDPDKAPWLPKCCVSSHGGQWQYTVGPQHPGLAILRGQVEPRGHFRRGIATSSEVAGPSQDY